MSQVKRLGMGLGALIGGADTEEAAATPVNRTDSTIGVSQIRPNPFQPRSEFDTEEIDRLADSIRRQGVLQPVVVRSVAGGVYELVAGERRWRAARKAGLSRIPAVVRSLDDRKMLELALVENIQRHDLNPMEKARAFRQLMQLNSWTQEQVAEAVGLGRPTVANFMRLLDLPVEVQEAVSRGTLSMGHARALLSVPKRSAMLQLLKRVITEDLSVRELEKLAGQNGSQSKRPKPSRNAEPYMQELEQKLMDKLGVRVEIMPEAIVIPYGSREQLTLILKRLEVL